MSKFVLSILKDGVPQKELANGCVPISFGSEFSLRFRNKNNRRSVVKFFIDGENVSGSGYVIPANDYIDIERHSEVNKKFKFVALDSPDAIDFGKNGPNEDKVKGVIEAQFFFEKEVLRPVTIIHQYPVYTPPTEIHHHHHHDFHHDYRPRVVYGTGAGVSDLWSHSSDAIHTANSFAGGAGASVTGTTGSGTSQHNLSKAALNDASVGSLDYNETSCSTAPEDRSRGSRLLRSNVLSKSDKSLRDGCTVEGESSQQRFTTSWVDLEDTYITLRVFLQGFDPDVEQVKVKHTVKPVTRKSDTIESEELTPNQLELSPTQLKIKELESKVEELKLAALEKEYAELQAKA